MELCIIECLHGHDSGHEMNNINNKQKIIKTTWDPAMFVAAHTLYEIVMNQYVSDVGQT